MGLLDQYEARTRAFYEWELRGRGWQSWPHPVVLEPPFRPFTLPQVTRATQIDDARHTTWLSRMVEGLTTKPPEEPEAVPETVEPEPDPAAVPADLAEYRLILPSDTHVSPELSLRWLATLQTCGQLAFEIRGTENHVEVILSGDRADALSALSHLESFLPEIQIDEAVPLSDLWEDSGQRFAIVEFGLAREFMLPLVTPTRFSPDPLTPLIGTLGVLDDELGVVQVLFEATRAPWREAAIAATTTRTGKPFFVDAPEITKAAEEKASSPLFAVSLRIAASAATDDRLFEILRRLAGGLATFGSPDGNEFIPLSGDPYPLSEDLLARTTHRSGMLLSAAELLALVHPPSEHVQVPALVRTVSRTKAAPQSVQADGILLGENTHKGQNVEVRLPTQARLRHTHVVGASGTGKSTLLVQMILQDIQDGRGVGVIDPHGDLIDEVLARLPPERASDVVFFDPSDDEYSVGWNILGARTELERELLASDLVGVFRRLSTSWGDQMTSVLSNAVLCFLDSSRGGTLLDLRRFLVDETFRREFLTTVEDAHLAGWWTTEFKLIAGRKPQGPILTRLDTFLRSKRVRRIVTVRHGLDFREIVDSGQILLVKLAQGAIGTENAALLGSLLVSKLHQVTLSRQELAADNRPPFYLYLDEFHEVATPSMATLFSGVRKYGLGLIVAHQDLYQFHGSVPEVERAVLANAHTRICFRLGDEDARSLGKGFAYFTPEDLMALQIGQAICRVGARDADFNLLTEKLDDIDSHDAREQRAAIRRLSGERWGQKVEEKPPEGQPAAEKAEEIPEPPKVQTPKPTASITAPASPKPQLSKALLDYLSHVATDPFQTIRERNDALNLSAWKGHQQKSELLDAKLIREVSVNPGGRGEQFKLLELTSEGRTVLSDFGVSVSTGHGRGGVAHQWWIREIARWLEDQGLSPTIEDDSRGARVDLSVETEAGTIAIEVEMGTRHLDTNIQNDLDAGYTQVVSLPDVPVPGEIAEQYQNAEGVLLADLREYQAQLASVLQIPSVSPPNQNQEPSRRKRRTAPPKREAVKPPHDWSDPGALPTPLAAEYLGLAPATLETLRSRGGGPPFVKLGRRVVYRREDLDKWLEDRVQKSTSDT